MRTLVTTHHLQLTDPSQLLRARSASVAYDLICIQGANPELNRFLYRSVGADWCWYERLNWSYERWMTYVCRAEVATWIATVGGSVAGYFELEDQDHGAVEIAYFGLLPAFIGSGLGAALLTDAAAAAWARGPQRVWLHTCSLDHPSALGNYRAQGFRVFKTVERYEDLPHQAQQAWPGAGFMFPSK